jgi:hypothetical protein
LIRAGDTITVFAAEDSKKRLVERLNRTPDTDQDEMEEPQTS